MYGEDKNLLPWITFKNKKSGVEEIVQWVLCLFCKRQT